MPCVDRGTIVFASLEFSRSVCIHTLCENWEVHILKQVIAIQVIQIGFAQIDQRLALFHAKFAGFPMSMPFAVNIAQNSCS
jgi:hypothetical protein